MRAQARRRTLRGCPLPERREERRNLGIDDATGHLSLPREHVGDDLANFSRRDEYVAGGEIRFEVALEIARGRIAIIGIARERPLTYAHEDGVRTRCFF